LVVPAYLIAAEEVGLGLVHPRSGGAQFFKRHVNRRTLASGRSYLIPWDPPCPELIS
jgi:hypothetical protein